MIIVLWSDVMNIITYTKLAAAVLHVLAIIEFRGTTK